MHFILEVELKDPPTAPGLALADDKAVSGTYTRSTRTYIMDLIIGSMHGVDIKKSIIHLTLI